jgi:hypothetical protein
MKELPSWQLKRTAPGGRADALGCGAETSGVGAKGADCGAAGALAAGATPAGPRGCTVMGAEGASGWASLWGACGVTGAYVDGGAVTRGVGGLSCCTGTGWLRLTGVAHPARVSAPNATSAAAPNALKRRRKVCSCRFMQGLPKSVAEIEPYKHKLLARVMTRNCRDL